MARRKPPAKPAKRKPAKPAKPRKAKAAPKPKADKVETPGMQIESAISLVTAIILIAAIALIMYERGAHYGEGPLKGQYSSGD